MIHKAFRTQCNQEGYRRGGVAHSKDWKSWDADHFTAEQYASIIEDRKIRHEIISDKPPVPVAKKAVKKDEQDDILSGK